MQEIAGVERLQPEELEVHIALGLQRRGNASEVEARKLGIEQFGGEPLAMKARRITRDNNQIFARTTRRVAATPTGRALIEQFRRIIAEQDEALASVADQ